MIKMHCVRFSNIHKYIVLKENKMSNILKFCICMYLYYLESITCDELWENLKLDLENIFSNKNNKSISSIDFKTRF